MHTSTTRQHAGSTIFPATIPERTAKVTKTKGLSLLFLGVVGNLACEMERIKDHVRTIGRESWRHLHSIRPKDSQARMAWNLMCARAMRKHASLTILRTTIRESKSKVTTWPASITG